MTLMMRPERLVADRHRNRRAGVGDFLAAHQAFGRVHGDGAHGVFAQMLRDFEHEAIAVVRRLQRVQNLRQMPVELHVDDGADDLGDAPRGLDCRAMFRPRLFNRQSASAPEMISISSLVIIA